MDIFTLVHLPIQMLLSYFCCALRKSTLPCYFNVLLTIMLYWQDVVSLKLSVENFALDTHSPL